MSALWNQRNQLVLLTLALFLTAIFIGASQNTANAQTLPFLISPYFGTETVTNPWSAAHQGIDFGMSYERVLSAADGSISQVAWYNNNSWCHQNPSDNTCGYGLYVYVQHSNGYVTRYAHLSTAAFGLGTFGTSVLSGQILGTSGNTGWSTGPHLHFEVRDSNGVSVNPASLWKDGQWATPSRPIPGPPDSSETVVDDIFVNTSSFSKGSGGESLNPCNGNCGGWTWANTGYGNGRFYTLADGGGTIDQWAKWQPTTLPTYNGIYEVFVYVPDNNATSWQAPYKIVHADGTSTAVVDQYGLFNQWVSIGTYRMNANSYVSTYDATGENSNQHCSGGWCQLGVDAIKFVRHATYAPDVRYGSGWTSTVTLRNNGGGYSKTNVNFLKSDGALVCQAATPFLGARQSISYYCPNTSVATVIVDGSEDLSVVVENIYDSGGRYLAAAYPGETAPATTVYVPFFLKKWPTLNSQWRQTSELMIQNTGSQSAGVTVTIYDSWDSDSGSASQSYTIPAGGRQSVPATDFSQNWDYGGFLAAARVSTTSGQPLAVVVNTLTGLVDGNGVITTPYLAGSYRAESQPANFLYASTTGREYNGYDSSLQVQNASGSNTTFRLKYYPLNSGTPTLTRDKTVGPYRSANFWRPTGMPAGFFGSATVEVLRGGPLAVMAQYDRFDVANSRYGVTQYEGVSSLNSSLGMAHIQKTNPWTYTGIQAQNRNSSPVSVQLHYFNPNGSSTGTSATKPNVPVNAAVNFWWTTGSPPEIPGGLNGSGVGSPANLALMVSFDRSGDPSYQNKDGMMGYAAVK